MRISSGLIAVALALPACATTPPPPAPVAATPAPAVVDAGTPPAAVADPISNEALVERTAFYEPIQEKAQPLTRDGRFDEALALFVAALPPDAGAVDYQALGNMHFRLNPEASLRFHRTALELAPTSALASLELGYDLLASGDAAAACPHLDVALRGRSGPANALLAACRLEGGDVTGALTAWKRAGFPKLHTRIESALGEVYGPPSPWLVRRRHLAAARATSAPGPVLELLAQDFAFEFDWWNTAPQLDLVERDLAEFGKRLSPTQRDAVTTMRAALTQREPKALGRVKALVARGKELDATTLRSLVVVGLTLGAISESDLRPLVAGLRPRALDPKSSQADLELLAALGQLTRDEALLDAVDVTGWKRFRARSFAQSYLLRKARDQQPAPAIALEDAVSAFPDSPFLQKLALDALPADDVAGRRTRLVALTLAEFKNLSLGGARGPRDASGLAGLLRELEALPPAH